MAIKNNGTLWGWGNNDTGQLGGGIGVQSTPTQKGSDTNWKTVTAGGVHTLSIKTDGTLWGWGYNAYGELGDGTTFTRLTPVQIGTENDWKEACTGYFHSIAIKNNGTLWSWGNNTYGQLGDGTYISKTTPTQNLKIKWHIRKELVVPKTVENLTLKD